jgi:hypothetical protein
MILQLKKLVKRIGPTTRSHSEVEVDDVPQWIPVDCCVVNDQPVGNPKRKV